jgi:NAD(P)-dependent dehydrogenase (short-subunit alcohol dehydrogenase family)
MTLIIHILPRGPLMQIEGTIALVTGANRGIGRAFADALLERGAAKVYGAARDVATITDPRAVPVQLDVTDPDRFAALADELGDVQVVVNNAGVGAAGFPLQASLDTARVQLETNYLSLVSSTQAFAPVLARNGGGAFVNVLSVVSWVAMPLLATYSASKAAAWSYTNAARIELRQQGTQVVGVHVGFVDTDLAAGLDVAKVPPAAVAAAALDAVQAGEPEAIVDEFSRTVKAGLSDDQRALYPRVEEEFLAMTR